MMTTLYKLTERDGTSYNNTKWSAGTTHYADTTLPAELCTAGVIHAYRSPLLAAMMYRTHLNFKDPVMWKSKGRVVVEDPTKVGCRSLTTIEEIPIPPTSVVQHVAFGILASLEVYREPSYVQWAQKWLSGEDRTLESARAAWVAEEAAEEAAWAATWAAWAAEEAAVGATSAARAAAWAARAAWAAWAAGANPSIDLVAIAEKAMKVKP